MKFCFVFSLILLALAGCGQDAKTSVNLTNYSSDDFPYAWSPR